MPLARTALLSLLLLPAFGCHERRVPERHTPFRDASRTPVSDAPAAVAKGAADASEPGVDASLEPATPWTSRAACLNEVLAGRRLGRAPGVVRVGTWNIRWFPDGRPGRSRAPLGTDLEWLGCALAWLDVDALSVQEFKATPEARRAADQVLRRAGELNSGRYHLDLDPCTNLSGLHVGVIHRSDRLRGSKPIVLAELNPHGEACKDQLRPGLAVYLEREGGLDFFLVSLHFKSGTARRDVTLRGKSLAALPAALRSLARENSDPDVVFAGDFNTMGCASCSPPLTAEAELAQLSRGLPAGFQRVALDARCTHAYGSRSAPLDQVVLRLSPKERPTRVAEVHGACRRADCRFGQADRQVREALSDHCPVVVDLMDVDED